MRLCRSSERLRDLRLDGGSWYTFHSEHRAEFVAGFGALRMLNEHRISPGARVPRHLIEVASLVTYVLAGELTCRDSFGRSSVCRAGEFSHTAGLRSIHYSEVNKSSDIAHVFQLYLLRHNGDSEPTREQKRFSVADRRGGWCAVAAPNGTDGALVVNSGAVVYSAIFGEGQHAVFELPTASRAWLHIVRGDAIVDASSELNAGDGVGFDAGVAVSLRATSECECLLIVTE